jgi:hypothetical protein
VKLDAAKHDWKVARKVAAESEVSAQVSPFLHHGFFR